MAKTEADRLTAWIETRSNPFLLREWRRRTRRGPAPVQGPLILCALATLLFVAATTVAAAGWVMLNRLPEEIPVTPSWLGTVPRGLGLLVVGLLAWLTLALAHWLSTGQTAVEERRETLDLLLVAPLSSAAVIRLLAEWPLLGVAAYLLPLLPLFVVVTPFLGLSFWAAVRALAVIFGMAALVIIRGPSASARRTGGFQRGLNMVGLQAMVALVAVPSLGWLLDEQFQLPGIGVLRWPVSLAALLVERRASWSGEPLLGPWLLVLYGLAVTARWLGAWGRLSEGTERPPPPANAAAVPAWLIAMYWLAGLWWGHHPGPGREVPCWYALHLATMAYLVCVLLFTRGRAAWLVAWLPARHVGHPVAVAVLRLLDTALVVGAAPLVWWLGTRQAGLAVAPPDWTATGEVAATALALCALRQLIELAAGSQIDAGREPLGARSLRSIGLLLVGAGGVVGLWQSSAAALTAGGWPAAFFGWPPRSAGVVGALAVFVAVAVAGATAQRSRRATAAGADRLASPLWRIAPRRWRENPLVVKAGRIARRGGFRRTGLAVVALAGLAGLLTVPWIQVTRAGLLPATGLPPEVELTNSAVLFGQHLAKDWCGVRLTPVAGGLLTQMLGFSLLMLVGLLTSGAAVCGRVVTDERLSGSLGLLLLSDLSDGEIADGWLVGQSHAVLETLTVYGLVVAAWCVAAGDRWVAAVGTILVCYVGGLVLSVCALAFHGTARYAARANGTFGAVLGLTAYHAAALLSALLGNALLASELPTVPAEWYLCLAALWALLTLVSGVLLWRSSREAVHRLRRATRLWLAFDTLGDKEHAGR